MSASGKQPRIDFSDVIRAYASVAVVVLHVLFSDDWRWHETSVWWFADILHAFVKPAVPLFVMVSGVFLLDPKKEFSIGKFWRGRFPRVFLPFLAWTLVYGAWNIFYEKKWPLSEFPMRFLTGNVFDHLWFVYMLAGLYLALPLLRRFTARATTAGLLYFLILWWVAVCAITLLTDGIENSGNYLMIAAGFTGYFVGGYWLCQLRIPRSSGKYLLLGIVVCALGNAMLAHFLAGRSDDYFDDDSSILSDLGPTVAILSFLVFAFIRTLDFERDRFVTGPIASAIRVLSATSYGMYLSHPIIFMVLGSGLVFGLQLSASSGSPWIAIPSATILGVVLSLVLLYILGKIPILRILSPVAKRHEPRASK